MKKLLKNLWFFPVIIITALGIGVVIHSESLVDLNVTGGISANDNPVTLNNGLLIKGANTEFRNASYDVFGTTVSAGTKYFEFTPSSATFRQGLYVQNAFPISPYGFFLSNDTGSVPKFFQFYLIGNTPIISSQNNGITIRSIGGSATENIHFDTKDAATMALFGSGGLSLGRTSVATDPGLNNFLLDGDISMVSGGSILSTANGNITLAPNGTGTIIFSKEARLLSDADPRTNLTPGAAGELVWNSTLLSVCVSSGTVATSWVKMEAPTTACQ